MTYLQLPVSFLHTTYICTHLMICLVIHTTQHYGAKFKKVGQCLSSPSLKAERNVSLRYILPIVHKEHEKYLVRVWAKKLIYMTTTLVYYLYRPNSPASLTDPLLWLNGQLIHQFMDKAFLNVFAKFLMIFHSSRKLTDLLRRQVNSAKVS